MTLQVQPFYIYFIILQRLAAIKKYLYINVSLSFAVDTLCICSDDLPSSNLSTVAEPAQCICSNWHLVDCVPSFKRVADTLSMACVHYCVL